MQCALFLVAVLMALVDAKPPRSHSHHGSHVCGQPRQPGPCLAYFRKWHFNATSGTCEQFVYGGCGGNSNNFWTKEACQRHCPDTPTPAPTPRPRIDTLPARRPSPYPDHCAGRPMCAMYCYNGFMTGVDGCPICRCNASPVQPKPARRPSSGNDRCAGRPMCLIACPNGFMTGQDGCDICQCKPVQEQPTPNCANKAACYIRCSFGHVLDAEGCRTCRCKPNPNPCRDTPPCYMRCLYGFEKHPNGCQKCQCKSAPMPLPCAGRPACYNRCLFGREMDTDGCPTCTCKQLPEVCRGRHICLMLCTNGFELDIEGCPTCRCQEALNRQAPTLPSVCSEPKEPGICLALIPRWYYDVTSGTCQFFHYGGCRGNGNNFFTQAGCEGTCRRR